MSQTLPSGRRYQPHSFEEKWRKTWEAEGLYRFSERPELPKTYALAMFPYPSGNLHIGHWYNYVAPDTRARYLRMRGFNVLFPMGFDAFGLPAENAAIKRGIDPRQWTYDNIATMTGQFQQMGTMIDWSRQFATCDPEYYRWNQWFFLQMFRKGLAYKKESLVNWDPVDQTVLANEQVINGRGDRSGALVERRKMRQWHLKITDYAEELLDFAQLDLPERVRLMQTHWIGRSEGAEVDFQTPAGTVTVFSTRPDTLFGATFLVLAPEHPLVEALTAAGQRRAVEAYQEATSRLSEIDRQAEGRPKTGVPLGSTALHPLSAEALPIWISDYVLASYGSGAVMGVPAHDQRDLEFARSFGLPIREVVRGPAGPLDTSRLEEAYTGSGELVNSGFLDGLPGGKEGIHTVLEQLSAAAGVRPKVTYRLRDWLISRQRYWGTPIPVVYCPSCGIQPVPEEQLPITLPEGVAFLPSGQSPLSLDADWKRASCPNCGGPAERETDTMDTFVDSSWYMYRFLSPHQSEAPFDRELVHRWLPVDVYTGGIEHAILHLLYSRFWTKVMRDLGLVDHSEPFRSLRNQGIVLGEDHEKMSKSRGNVVDPDQLVAEYGSDTVRTYLMFMAPWESGGPWDPTGISGPFKWLSRVYTMLAGESEGPEESVRDQQLRQAVHSTLQRVGDQLEQFAFNTAIAQLMELTNLMVKAKRSPISAQVWEESAQIFNLMLAPFAPHLAEELWSLRGQAGSVHLQAWPAVDAAAAQPDLVEIVVQVAGKVRGRVRVPPDADEALVWQEANKLENVTRHLGGGQVRRIFVPGRLINLVPLGQSSM
jgi:leucyl-tRNA synthetase